MAEELDNDQGSESDLFLEPIISKNPFEDAFSQLARAIRLGAVPVGEKFPSERTLSERLGVSRHTIREAIRGLEKVGYISTRRGRYGGSFVEREESLLVSSGERKTTAEILEMLDFRIVIEPGVAALAADRAGEEQIEEMRVLVKDEEADSFAMFLRANCRLHIMFAQAAHCTRLLRQVTAVEDEYMELLLELPNILPSETRSHVQHLEIIDAIADEDAVAARNAMQEHLTGTDLVIRELASQGASGAV